MFNQPTFCIGIEMAFLYPCEKSARLRDFHSVMLQPWNGSKGQKQKWKYISAMFNQPKYYIGIRHVRVKNLSGYETSWIYFLLDYHPPPTESIVWHVRVKNLPGYETSIASLRSLGVALEHLKVADTNCPS